MKDSVLTRGDTAKVVRFSSNRFAYDPPGARCTNRTCWHWIPVVLLALALSSFNEKALADELTVMDRIEPVDELIADAKAFASIFSRRENNKVEPAKEKEPDLAEEFGKQIEKFIESRLGEDWRKAIDTIKPIDFGIRIDADSQKSNAALLLPHQRRQEVLGHPREGRRSG